MTLCLRHYNLTYRFGHSLFHLISEEYPTLRPCYGTTNARVNSLVILITAHYRESWGPKRRLRAILYASPLLSRNIAREH